MAAISDSFTVLVADDDPDDQLLIKDALAEVRSTIRTEFVDNGVDLLDYLRRQGPYVDLINSPMPRLLLLDLNMPIEGGREALFEIKSDPGFWRLPIIIFSTSSSEVDVRKAYQLGANSFVTKPPSFERLVEILRAIDTYWFETVALPSG